MLYLIDKESKRIRSSLWIYKVKVLDKKEYVLQVRLYMLEKAPKIYKNE